ncbi:MAG: copper resistance protein CopD, partial [Steroidobacteraceae bacterium]
MLEPVVVFLRLAQYAGAAVLFGAALLNLRAPPMYEQTTPTCSPGSRRLLMASATLILVASVLGLLAQTSVLAGSLSEGLQIGSLSAAVTTMAFGPSSLVRAAAAAGALFVGAALPMGRRLHATCTLLGAVILGSFAWMGHGAATRG